MIENKMFHHSQLTAFRNPFGAVACNNEIALKIKVQHFASQQPAMVVLRLWLEDSYERKIEMQRCPQQDDLYQAVFLAPRDAGIVWYYFIITIDGHTVYYGNNHEQLGGEGVVYHAPPASFQITIYHDQPPAPTWFHHAVMYQIFPDRFCAYQEQGRLPAVKAGCVLQSAWDNTPYYICDVDTKEIVAYDFFGGNLAGIISKLPYLKQLGITVIYLNPVFESVSNHRYDTGDYHKIDSLLGDNILFAELCSAAQLQGMAVVLDGVFSHTGSDSRYFNKYGNYPEVGAYQSPQSRYYNWYRFKTYPAEYECWWGIDTLPNVEENERSYSDFIIHDKYSVVRYWSSLGIKGWRLDVVDELPDKFLKDFAKALKETDPEAVLIGEVWEDASNKSSYGAPRHYFGGDKLDSVMNYPFRQILLDFMMEQHDGCMTQRLLMSLYENYPHRHFYALMNLLGSHDVERILTLLGGAGQTAGLSTLQLSRFRLNEEARALAVARLKVLVAWQMTFPGVPSVYYGDEAGVEGHKDPFNRRTYPWNHENTELLEWHRRLIALRHAHPLFRTGEWLPLYGQGDVYGYIRRITNGRDVFGQPQMDGMALVLINRSTTERIALRLEVAGLTHGTFYNVLEGGDVYSIQDGQLVIDLPALEVKILLKRQPQLRPRECGILCHISSLPSRYGIGDLGKEAYRFINFLHKAGQKLWQILPLNPIGLGHSPYQSPGVFAGNFMFISLGQLVLQRLLSRDDIKATDSFSEQQVDFPAVAAFKERCLRQAYENFLKDIPEAYRTFVEQQAGWLNDYTLFTALKQHCGGSWTEWPDGLADRKSEALEFYRELLKDEIGYQQFLQYLFFSQWKNLKAYANRHGIEIVGDMPIFVAHDSADVWAQQALFDLDAAGNPRTVAGVPPDYFSLTGQLWGNPQYQWTAMKASGYYWWSQRFSTLLQLVDIVRVDHFRGFEAYWEIAAGAHTAVDGRWVSGPGADFFAALEQQLGKLPVIAEDLGFVTPAVEALKDNFGYPGMHVLQFALTDESLPFGCDRNSVVYTGTHDNNTTVAWFRTRTASMGGNVADLHQILELGQDAAAEDVCWRLIEFAYASNANTAIIPLQDVLCLDGAARMNTPGTIAGNWIWRCPNTLLSSCLATRLKALAMKYQR